MATTTETYPIHKVRFVNGRSYHRTKRPQDERWWDELEAACGKRGYLARGWSIGSATGRIGPCRGCQKALDADPITPTKENAA